MKAMLGRYMPGKSTIHSLNPILKVLFNIFYIVSAFLAKDIITFFVLLIPLFIMYLISIKRVRPLFRMLKIPFFIAVFLLLINFWLLKNVNLYESIRIFQNNTNTYNIVTNVNEIIQNSKEVGTAAFKDAIKGEWYQYFVWYSNESVAFSLFAVIRSLAIFLRIYIMILSTTILTLTTKPIMLTKALEDIIWPLKLVGVSTQIVAITISIALRFVPTLLDEASRIMKAQSSRGVDFKKAKLKEKAKSMITLVVPLFVSSFAKAEDLANAMETRGYDPYAKRTRYRQIGFNKYDIMLAIFSLIIFAGIITLNTFHNYYPEQIFESARWYAYLVTRY
ncbi:energy-coupling factor transporter transmembrane component T [Mycoplasma sp. M5725]|uniref:Energy-coupling factor transporter transmembrane component T n=1 Tax=Mycoplasma phocimorsus TaxID=3045839 RepID=A0AAJ1PSR5_9MOLU|nr:energy-coupling factor transporter transmembrane component T [Mycoplasma phocimorsus]MDJ1645532.1 energy-coupling factor transporter transmembrane component T [Mycoplasma phocimorsus]